MLFQPSKQAKADLKHSSTARRGYSKMLEVSGMTWVLVKDDVDALHVEIELDIT
jgi:hypothetical protein